MQLAEIHQFHLGAFGFRPIQDGLDKLEGLAFRALRARVYTQYFHLSFLRMGD
jgi:hypothetical protein